MNRYYRDDDDDDQQPASFEVIHRYTADSPQETVYHQASDQGGMASSQEIYNRVNTAVGAAAGEEPVPDRPEGKARDDCKRYLDLIKENVGPDDGEQDPMVIALIGNPGVGKSSLVCTLAAAISQERWREYAYVGSHGEEGEPVTVYVETFGKCGMEKIPRNEEKFKEHLLPTIVDIAGVENENNELWKELLEIVFFGKLPKGESLYAAYRYGQTHGVEGLKQKYFTVEEKLKVKRIIFLASATEETPENLIDCVRAAARPPGDSENKRAIPLFGVMTKIDRVETSDKPGEVSREVFSRREERFIHKLGLGGVTTRYLAMSNYCDATDSQKKRLESNIPKMDAPLLQFMIQVSDPAIQPINDEFRFDQKGTEWVAPNQGLRKRKVKENEQNKKNEKTEQKSQNKVNDELKPWQYLFAVLLLIVVVFMLLASFSKR